MRRLHGYDYSRVGAYFVTACTHGRVDLFGKIVKHEMRLNVYGRMVQEVWDGLPGHYPHVEYSARDLVCGYHLALLRPLKAVINGAYLFRSLQCSVIAHQFHISANGVTRYGLSRNGIKSPLLPVPPIAEQVAIVRYLDKATADIDASIDRARREIELLSEYRTRLIADVVTGQVDVRDAATRLSNEAETLIDAEQEN